MASKDKALDAIEELEGLIASGGGSPDPEALRSARTLLFQLETAPGPNLVVQFRLKSLERWLAVLFSDEAHRRYGGLEAVRGSARADLESLRAMVSSAPGDRGPPVTF